MNIFDLFRNKKRIPSPWEKYYSKEDLNIEIPNISMYDQVKISAFKYPNNKAIVYEGKTITYKKLMKKIDNASDSFKKLGVRKGSIVTICLPNVPECLIALYALNKMGAIANMVHPLSSEEEIKESINSTKSSYLIMMDQFYSKIENIIDDTKIKKVIMVCGVDQFNILIRIIYKARRLFKFKHHPISSKYISWMHFRYLSLFSKKVKYKRFSKNTPAVILHSGGTSGTPKNVVIQNRAFILGSKQEKAALKRLKEKDSCLAIMPNFHGFGLSVCMHTPLTFGAYTILIPQFDAKKFDVLFAKTNPSCVLGVPTLFEALINSHNVKNLDLSNLKYVISGGDILTSSLEEKINKYLKKHNSSAKITQGYGLSECLAAVSLGFDDVNKSGSVGIPFPTNHIKIIDEERNTLKPGKIGEIVINSKALMMGYLNNDVETNAALQIHKDGHIWLHTGDLGCMDEDGFLYYKGRLKRMIITSGYNVYPAHVEEVIERHPAVLQCSVVGIPHPYKKQVGKAFIVLNEGYHSVLVKGDIKDFCKKNLAHYMIPAEFVFRKQLPKTKLGKVDFKKLESDFGDNDE